MYVFLTFAIFAHYDIALRREADGKNMLVVEYWLNSIHHVAKEIPLKGSKPYLRVTGSREHYRFAYSEDARPSPTLAWPTPATWLI